MHFLRKLPQIVLLVCAMISSTTVSNFSFVITLGERVHGIALDFVRVFVQAHAFPLMKVWEVLHVSSYFR